MDRMFVLPSHINMLKLYPPSATVLEDRAFMEVIKVKCSRKGRILTPENKKNRRDQNSVTLYVHTLRKGHVSTSEKAVVYYRALTRNQLC